MYIYIYMYIYVYVCVLMIGPSIDIGKYRFTFEVSVYIDIGKVEGICIEYFTPIPI